MLSTWVMLPPCRLQAVFLQQQHCRQVYFPACQGSYQAPTRSSLLRATAVSAGTKERFREKCQFLEDIYLD